MLKRCLATIAVAVMATTAFVSADYSFPSPNPPGGKSVDEVKQFVSIIWDDNAYSGLSATQYEDKPGTDFAASSFIDGIAPWGNSGKPNTLNLTEGMIGMSWAITTLAGQTSLPPTWEAIPYAPNSKVLYEGNIYTNGNWSGDADIPGGNEQWNPWKLVGPADMDLKRKNPDGSPIRFTFNVISGLFVPIWGQGWESYESKFGYFTPNEAFYKDGRVLHSKISVSWGREMAAYTGCDKAEDTTAAIANGARQGGQIVTVFKSAMEMGHEVGNHTIDHMESNSPLPVDFYEGWESDRVLNGFDYSKNDTMPWKDESGNPVVYDEGKEFGQVDGNPWQTMGWRMYAGKYISKDTWKGAIELSEDQLEEYIDLTKSSGKLNAFRAPRLEVNSGLYFALSELGYQYDCGLEEGYESNIDGTNFLWPYTVDNGNPNSSYQRSIGVNVAIDSMPAGLWQIPSNVFIVPESQRQLVYDHYKEISLAANSDAQVQSFEDWVSGGAKITGYDFNMYILWGMTKEAWLETMKHNVRLRKKGNKAPIHYGAHTDYYTPIYDNATLQNDFNASSFGLNITKGWNDWKVRISSMEEFIDWGTAEGCHFVTGHQLVEEIKKYQADEKFGKEQVLLKDKEWVFYPDGVGSTASKTSSKGGLESVKVTVRKESGGQYPNATFAMYDNAGSFEGLTHIELEYETTTPLQLKLAMKDGPSYEVPLGNLNVPVKSGRIPLSAFQYNQYQKVDGKQYKGLSPAVKTKDIIGIEVKVITDAQEDETHNLTIKNVKLYQGEATSISAKSSVTVKQNVAIASITKNALQLNLTKAGSYSVDIHSVDGRLIQSFKNSKMSLGLNKLILNSFASGIYMIRVKSGSFQTALKAVVL